MFFFFLYNYIFLLLYCIAGKKCVQLCKEHDLENFSFTYKFISIEITKRDNREPCNKMWIKIFTIYYIINVCVCVIISSSNLKSWAVYLNLLVIHNGMQRNIQSVLWSRCKDKCLLRVKFLLYSYYASLCNRGK